MAAGADSGRGADDGSDMGGSGVDSVAVDILDELRHLQEYGVMNVSEHVAATDLLGRAIAEIQFLRGMAGAVTQGESFREIKKAAKDT